MVPPLLSPACTAEVEKVVRLSQEEHLQPFKDNMEAFLSQGRAAEHPLPLTPLPVFTSLPFLCSSDSSSSVHLTPLPVFISLLFLCFPLSSSCVHLTPLALCSLHVALILSLLILSLLILYVHPHVTGGLSSTDIIHFIG